MFFYSSFSAVMFSNKYVFTQAPTPRAGCDTRSVFKQIKPGLNSEISFSQISFLNKAKNPVFPIIFL